MNRWLEPFRIKCLKYRQQDFLPIQVPAFVAWILDEYRYSNDLILIICCEFGYIEVHFITSSDRVAFVCRNRVIREWIETVHNLKPLIDFIGGWLHLRGKSHFGGRCCRQSNVKFSHLVVDDVCPVLGRGSQKKSIFFTTLRPVSNRCLKSADGWWILSSMLTRTTSTPMTPSLHSYSSA